MPSKRVNRSKRGGARKSRVSALLSDGPAYAQQPTIRISLPCNLGILNTTVTTGVVAQSSVISSSSVQGFATRFGSTFDEYRIVGADVEIRALTSGASGVSRHFFDEKSSAAPSLADGEERLGTTLPNASSNPASVRTMRWRARDLLDLEYTAIGTATTPVYFKTYTDTANFGSPTTVTPLWLGTALIHFEFRGLKAV
jgi:hypothetical protein